MFKTSEFYFLFSTIRSVARGLETDASDLWTPTDFKLKSPVGRSRVRII